MTPTQTATARKLATLPGFAWSAGMRVVMADLEKPKPTRVVGADPFVAAHEGEWSAIPCTGTVGRDVPDLADAATGGVLLVVLGPGWAGYQRQDGTCWEAVKMHDHGSAYYSGTTLAEASAKAHIARGRYGVAP